MKHDEARALIEAQHKGAALDAEQSSTLFAHLGGCAKCRAFYDRCAQLEAALEGTELPTQAMRERLLARGAPAPRAPASILRWPLIGAGALAAVAAVALLAVPGPAEAPEFGVRGGPGASSPWITIYRLEDGEITPLEGPVSRGEPLLFAYSSKGEDHNLMIVGLDARGRAHWYHPAYTDEDQDPVSLPIEAGVTERALPERVYVEPAPGALELCAIFTAGPLKVKAVDEALEGAGRWPEDARLDCHRVEVLP